MTRTDRTKKNLEQKIVELQIRLSRRQTRKISRLVNLRKRIEFYKQLLAEAMDADVVSNASAGIQNDGVTSLSTESNNK